ncbi:phosphatase PAP2 family protein [Mesorhizobium sp. AR07]|uniref:phosphatase PAP2 family protein n=1 Tax=Mesorhizobium sp. AR07 TaxID=2865838 RepID=UPI00216067CF|nr:phosphatase PAP2 family protein [Mesorhizobium sp. AR07]UVK46660.1 phosphatase PAP2 family protein [Mesorhizobium sp. AR07]
MPAEIRAAVNTEAIRDNPEVQRNFASHPRFWRWLARRFSTGEPFGLRLTVGTALSLVFLWLFFSIGDELKPWDSLVLADLHLMSLVQMYRSPHLNKVMAFITCLGNWQIVGACAGLIAVYLAVTKQWRWILALLISIVGEEILSWLGKTGFARPRPDIANALVPAEGWSFPSSHAFIAVSFYGLIAWFAIDRAQTWRTKVLIALLAAVVILAIGFSRIYLGVHWPSDVLASLALGAAWLTVVVTSFGVARASTIETDPYPRHAWIAPVACVLCVAWGGFLVHRNHSSLGVVETNKGNRMALHYASGGSAAEIATAGFNLADVSSVEQLKALPAGMKGLVWLDEVNGASSSFVQKVTPFIGNPKVFGFFLVDEPDPTGKWGTYATAANLKAESDWIHSNLPGAKTFITTMNMGSFANPDFSNTFNPANTHIDYYGVDAYPVQTGTSAVDYNMIDRTVAAAVASGVPLSQVVPVYQTFGGGNFTTETGGKYALPTVAQEQTMMAHWATLVPSPAFDYAYAWGSQQGDTALGSAPALQAFFLQHNLHNLDNIPVDNLSRR